MKMIVKDVHFISFGNGTVQASIILNNIDKNDEDTIKAISSARTIEIGE